MNTVFEEITHQIYETNVLGIYSFHTLVKIGDQNFSASEMISEKDMSTTNSWEWMCKIGTLHVTCLEKTIINDSTPLVQVEPIALTQRDREAWAELLESYENLSPKHPEPVMISHLKQALSDIDKLFARIECLEDEVIRKNDLIRDLNTQLSESLWCETCADTVTKVLCPTCVKEETP